MAYVRRTVVQLCLTALVLPFRGTGGKSWPLQIATFVPPASPTLKRSEASPSTFFAQLRPKTQLLSKKKVAPASVKKIQVKMLKYIDGTGSIGDIVMVAPAFFNNKLRPTSSAVIISDEEVKKEEAEATALEKEINAKAEALKERMDDLSLNFKRKAGPDGQLFGGIGPKGITEELDKVLADDFLNHKGVKIVAITDGDGMDMRGDIKHTGKFGATLALTKNISATFTIVVDPEC